MASPSDNLDELVKLFQEANVYMSMFTPQFQRVVTSVEELETTLVMVGNNIVDQIRISGMGGPGTGQATESEQKYQSAVLENLNNWLSTLNVITVEAMDRAQDNADLITNAISTIQSNNQTQRNTNGGAGGRPEAMAFKNIISGMQGGLLTATASISKEFMKFGQQLSIARGSGGIGGLIASATLLSGVVTAMPAAFGEMTKYISMFVSAVDPGLMAKLGLVVSDLMAVIGRGLKPIIIMVVAVLRLFADMLAPIMDSMSVAMTSLGDAIMKIAIPFVLAWAYAIKQMIPVIDGVSKVADENAIVFSILAGTLEVIISVISGVFNLFIGGLQTVIGAVKFLGIAFLQLPKIIEEIKDWIPGIGKNQEIIDAANKQQDALAGGVVGNLKNAFDSMKAAFPSGESMKRGSSTGAAAKQASYTGIADLGKNLMQAAFSSSTEAVAQKQLNAAEKANGFLQQIAGFLGVQVAGPDRKAAGVRG